MFPHDDVYIHIGMPKTATRTFQYHYFTPHDEIEHIGKKKPDPIDRNHEFIEAITDTERWEFKRDESFFSELDQETVFDADSKYVISAEAFSTGSSHTPQVDRYTIAERLHTLFPQAEIVVTFRNQLDVLKSVYLQERKLATNQSTFEEWIEDELNQFFRTNKLEYFDYHDIMAIYSEFYDTTDINVLFFEDLVADQEKYVRELSSILGIASRPELLAHKHENPSLTTVTLLWNKMSSVVPQLNAIPPLLPEWVKNKIKRTGSELEVSYSDHHRSSLEDLMPTETLDSLLTSASMSMRMIIPCDSLDPFFVPPIKHGVDKPTRESRLRTRSIGATRHVRFR